MREFTQRKFECTLGALVLALGCADGGGEAPGEPDAGVTAVDASDARLGNDGSGQPDGPALIDATPDVSDTVAPDADQRDAGAERDASAPCLPEMAPIGAFCVDRYEAYVVELGEDGAEVAHSPFVPVDGLEVRAKSAPGVNPQGYISQVQAVRACSNAGKRLCTAAEFALACRGDDSAAHYPYTGPSRVAGACNEGKGAPMVRLFGSDPSAWTYADFNDARLNQLSDTLAPTGSYPQCASPYGVYDCVGNLNEWGADPLDARGHAVWRGGSFVDSEINGPGCLYVTTAHDATYHDYSTGFRCCADKF